MEDDRAPTIADARPADGANVPKRPAIRACVTDIGSGIGEITVTCAGQWLLMEYDPERELIEWARDEDLPAGECELEFRVTDAADNTAAVAPTIHVAE